MAPTIDTCPSALEQTCTLLPSILKNWRPSLLHNPPPLSLGLPQPQQFLPAQACKEAPWVGGTNSKSMMGIPTVSREFPPSFLSHSHSPPVPRDLCNTILPHLDSPSLPQLNHLPFGNPLPSPKPDSLFRVGFCNIGGFPAIAKNNNKVLDPILISLEAVN